jgi:5-enolpyruvylshikimate-3-phosphate synthase
MFDYNTQPRKFRFQGEITVPGDKSIAHRAIIFGRIS